MNSDHCGSTADGSIYGCSQCGEARQDVYTCRDGGESVRVCPRDPEGEKGCWWVVQGHPHGEGHACICLIPVKNWTDAVESDEKEGGSDE